MLPRTRHRFAGAPVALPALLDRASEAWWRARPRTRTATALGLALLVVSAGVGHAASDPDGPPTTVWVAARDLLPGDALGPADVTRRSWPAELVPAGTLDRPDGTVTAALPEGAVVTDRHLGERGVVASVPPDRVAVAVPLDQLPALTAGTRVDLVGPGPDGTGQLLASRATVVGQDPTVLWVAVDPAASVAVSAAVAASSLAVVVHPD